MTLRLPLLGLLLLSMGCELILNGKTVGADSGTSDDGSGGGVGGGSGGGGSGGGSGGGDGDDGLCAEDIAPADYDDGCITAALACGGSLTATITGGTTLLKGSEYSSFWACEVVGTEAYAGAERMFAFEHPGTGDVTVTLNSPCANLDLFVMHWEDAGDCPRPGVSIGECDADISGGGGAVTIWNNAVARYVVVVEGANGEEDNFGLSLSCP